MITRNEALRLAKKIGTICESAGFTVQAPTGQDIAQAVLRSALIGEPPSVSTFFTDPVTANRLEINVELTEQQCAEVSLMFGRPSQERPGEYCTIFAMAPHDLPDFSKAVEILALFGMDLWDRWNEEKYID